jgi:hypothetical protein
LVAAVSRSGNRLTAAAIGVAGLQDALLGQPGNFFGRLADTPAGTPAACNRAIRE